jgi:hypothetical protein
MQAEQKAGNLGFSATPLLEFEAPVRCSLNNEMKRASELALARIWLCLLFYAAQPKSQLKLSTRPIHRTIKA